MKFKQFLNQVKEISSTFGREEKLLVLIVDGLHAEPTNERPFALEML